MNSELKEFNEVYESTADFGRTQFVREIIRLQNKIKELEDINSSLELEIEEKITEMEIKIKDFMFKLKLDGCYTKELEEFITSYGKGLFY